MRGPRTGLLVTVLCASISAAEAPGVLQSTFGLTDAQVQAIERGEVVAHHLPSASRDEIAALGIVRVGLSPEAYLKTFSHIETFEGGPAVGQIRRVSSPPVREDFAGLSLPEDDLRELPRCRRESCEVQVDAATIDRIVRDRNRGDADMRAASAAAMQEMLLGLSLRYLAEGIAALPVYRDRPEPVSVADNLRSLLEHKEPFPIPLDNLRKFIADYPRAPLPGSREALFWTVNTFGLKATLRLNHAVEYTPEDSTHVAGVIAVSQLYATHYFHSALEMRFVMRDPTSPDRMYLANVSRSRSDGLTGIKGTLIGGIIRRRALEGVRKYMRFTKERLERR